MQTPYFLIHKDKLDTNILQFKTALEKIWPHSMIAYSVKTNSLPWVLKHLKSHDIQAEVVSDEEYELSLLCGFKEDEIVFNGPIKGADTFLEAVRKGSIVNIDSKNEVALFREHIKESKSTIGVRVNIDPSLFDRHDIGYAEDGFRFGFSEEDNDLGFVIDTIRLNDKTNRIGLHFHCNSVSRSLDVYRKIAEYAKYIIGKYDIDPSFIDIGGGFFGGVAGKPSATDYIRTIHEVLKEVVDVDNTLLIVEPGSAIIGSAVDFHTSVVDIKDTSKSRVVTTDGSRINIDPLWAKDRYTHTFKRISDDKSVIRKQIICGYTCMDHDRLMTLLDEKALSIGDQLIYEKVGAYSMTFGGPFIRYFPEVYVARENEAECVRRRLTVKDYYDMHTIS